jgi:hypothetical protein
MSVRMDFNPGHEIFAAMWREEGGGEARGAPTRGPRAGRERRARQREGKNGGA